MQALKKLNIFSLLIFVTHNFIHPENLQNRFCTLSLPQYQTNLHFADNSKIELKNQSSYFLLTMKWQQKINKGFMECFTKIQNESKASVEHLFDLLSNKNAVQKYHEQQEQFIVKLYEDLDTIKEEELNYCFLNFLQKNFKKYSSIDNFEFALNPTIPGICEVLYDAKSNKYIIVLNAVVYNYENIDVLQNNHKQTPLYFHKENGDSKISLNYLDLLNSGFAAAASKIDYQINILIFILIHYKFYASTITDETLILLARLKLFKLNLEIIFQSNDPLETAIFYQTVDPYSENEKHWNHLIEDIKNLYSKRSLQKFQKISSSL